MLLYDGLQVMHVHSMKKVFRFYDTYVYVATEEVTFVCGFTDVCKK